MNYAWVPPDPPPLKSIDEEDETPPAALVLRLHPPSVVRCLHAVYQVTSAHSLITCWTIILLNTKFVQQRDERESDMSKDVDGWLTTLMGVSRAKAETRRRSVKIVECR